MTRAIPQEHKEQGNRAEEAFLHWLDAHHTAHIYQDQSVATQARDFKNGGAKRPDFIIGIPLTGSIAVDVKCKTLYDDAFIIDVAEYDALDVFETQFQTAAWFAIYDPNFMSHCYITPNKFLKDFTPKTIRGTKAYVVPTDYMRRCDTRAQSFYDAHHKVVTGKDV